mgnify:CR=1 FL=1
MNRNFRSLCFVLVAGFLCFAAQMPIQSPAEAADGASSSNISIELNKLEPNGKGCRIYVVANNPTATAYQVLKLDLVLFRPDGLRSISARSRKKRSTSRPSTSTLRPAKASEASCSTQCLTARRDSSPCLIASTG